VKPASSPLPTATFSSPASALARFGVAAISWSGTLIRSPGRSLPLGTQCTRSSLVPPPHLLFLIFIFLVSLHDLALVHVTDRVGSLALCLLPLTLLPPLITPDHFRTGCSFHTRCNHASCFLWPRFWRWSWRCKNSTHSR
jgi:hypothetical protein